MQSGSRRGFALRVTPHFLRDVRRMILIAERDLNVRKLQEFFLAQAGFAVEFVDDGATALERARVAPPSLLITEILIPKLDGLALVRRLREDVRTCGVPVLVFTILAAEARALEAGAAFLRKPLVDSTFVAAVQELAAQQDTPSKEPQWATK
jgi:DNA-binding response OmpR family regulator